MAMEIVKTIYALDLQRLSSMFEKLGVSDGLQVINHLDFDAYDTGGGCLMLTAELPNTNGHRLVVTDGEAGIPANASLAWVAIVDPEGDEIYNVVLKEGILSAIF